MLLPMNPRIAHLFPNWWKTRVSIGDIEIRVDDADAIATKEASAVVVRLKDKRNQWATRALQTMG